MGAPVIPNISHQMAMYGVLPYDAEAYIFDKPSQITEAYPALKPKANETDTYNGKESTATEKKKSGWDTFGKVVLGTIGIGTSIFLCKKYLPELFGKLLHPIKSLTKK